MSQVTENPGAAVCLILETSFLRNEEMRTEADTYVCMSPIVISSTCVYIALCIRKGVIEENFVFGHSLHFGQYPTIQLKVRLG